ncbi:unnamed protein product [Prunus armeniaca]
MSPTGPVDQYGKFDPSVDRESFEVAHTWRLGNLSVELEFVVGTSIRSGTRTTQFALTYGHDAVLSLEISVRSLRVARHGEWSKDEYNQAMTKELDDLDEVRVDALVIQVDLFKIIK